ncbi:hypothetical protein TorRG33x02_202000, partial [Trema orientale]
LCAKLTKNVEKNLRRMFDHYNEVYFGVVPSITTSSTSFVDIASSNVSTQPGRILSKFVSKKREMDGGKLKNEVDKYLSDDTEDFVEGKLFDILKWWSGRSDTYKVLSLIARDILAIPVTTVPSEAAFSIGGRILDPFRSSLSPRTVEGLICLKNWYSESNQPIILKEYMDEMEVLETSEQLESEITIASIGSQPS